ncbi:MAG TPA: S9 family peptidase [Roseiflexaceae bacterium]|nr:S9 family peptidase [Roseiflexaceae bacterium]
MTNPKRAITPEDMADFTRLSDLQISPDGALVVFVAGEYFKADSASARSRIWLAPAAGAEPRPLTGGPRTDSCPRWSPDGRRLAFLSDRLEDGRPQIYLLERDGAADASFLGEARRLTDLRGEIEELEWSPDGARLAFLLTEPETEEQRRRKQAKDDAIEVERNHRWRHVWTVDVASGELRQITSGAAQVWEFSWAPDGGFALLVGAEPYEWSWFVARLARVGAQGGLPQTIYSLPEKQFACPRVSPDGTRLAFLSCIWSDRGINGGDVFVIGLEAWDLRLEDGDVDAQPASNLTAGYGGSIWWIEWSADGAALDYMAYEDGQAAIGRIDLATGVRVTRWKGAVAFDEHFSSRHIDRATGAIAVLREDPTRPQDIWLAAEQTKDQRPKTDDSNDSMLHDEASFVLGPSSLVDLEWRQLTHFHPQACELALGETRELRWYGSDGMPIQGLLILPVGYQPGLRVPLIAWVHGGPAWLYTHCFYGAGRYPQQLFAGAGYAVLLANPRGSAGWGVDFTEANIGDFGGCDYVDIIAGVDHLIGLGIADPDRLGIGGWSYGGFMTAWAITQTSRFKAAMMGAGICNWRSFHGVAEIGTWDRISYRASPYEQGGRYDRFSPIHYVDRVQTPTLIVHGTDDIIVPVSQSYEFFRALKDHGVPTELVVYPREPHGFRERLHNLDRFRRYLEWFQRYLPV